MSQSFELTANEYNGIKSTLYDMKIAIIVIGSFTGVSVIILFLILIIFTAKRARETKFWNNF